MQDELFQPYSRLIEIQIQDQSHQVPDNNILLRCFQYICLEDVSCGRFCWNQECKNALSCQTMVSDGMKITKISKELRWALRSILTEPAEKVF